MKLCDIPNPFGGPVYRFESVVSTMDEAARLSAGGTGHGTIIMADYQSLGQGRVSGRRWISPPGESLMFTLVLEAAVTGSPLEVPYSLVAGLAVCRTLEPYTSAARIKWPNDVLLEGRKCAGILTRTRCSQVHIGIGINCLQRTFEGDFKYHPTSILEASGRTVLPEELLPHLLEEMLVLLDGGWSLTAFNEVLYGYGTLCTVKPGLPGSGEEFEGIITGLGERGELVVARKGSGEVVEITSGEITAL